MSGWYLCTNISSAVDAYDAMGVVPGPGDAGCTAAQRIMKLSAVPGSIIQECYDRTLASIDTNSADADRVEAAYSSLMGDSRKSYDAKLLTDMFVPGMNLYSICTFLNRFSFWACLDIYIYIERVSFYRDCKFDDSAIG